MPWDCHLGTSHALGVGAEDKTPACALECASRAAWPTPGVRPNPAINRVFQPNYPRGGGYYRYQVQL
jgi:hypothetical protein